MNLSKLRRCIVVTAAGVFVALFVAERRRPLRPRVEPGLGRLARNMMVAATAGATVGVLETPLVMRLAKRRLGLVERLPLPAWARTALAVALMDYTLYAWHVLTHRVPFLWRFHLVHHVDLDLDATTSFRFHFGEMALSVPWRVAQVLAIGPSPEALALWQGLTSLSIMFHHSDVRLPAEVERVLERFVMTPRLHGIHHSAVERETNSNWSSGLAAWDWIHGTRQVDVGHPIRIGVPAWRSDLDLISLMAMPFGPQRDDWRPAGREAPPVS
jgi:sterol desaturase/sphingolipid hydroxylase (fatty acid hydroxylase superfamily)